MRLIEIKRNFKKNLGKEAYDEEYDLKCTLKLKKIKFLKGKMPKT